MLYDTLFQYVEKLIITNLYRTNSHNFISFKNNPSQSRISENKIGNKWILKVNCNGRCLMMHTRFFLHASFNLFNECSFLCRRQLTVMKALAMDADDILNANLVTLKVDIPDLLLQVSSIEESLLDHLLVWFHLSYMNRPSKHLNSLKFEKDMNNVTIYSYKWSFNQWEIFRWV